jgi:hypothetical protein
MLLPLTPLSLQYTMDRAGSSIGPWSNHARRKYFETGSKILFETLNTAKGGKTSPLIRMWQLMLRRLGTKVSLIRRSSRFYKHE